MKTTDFLYLALFHRTLDYQKDPNPKNWVTINGARVHLDGEGKVDGGAGGKLNGKKVSSSKVEVSEEETNVTIPGVETDMFDDEEQANKEIDARESAWKKILSDPNLHAAQWQDEGGKTYVISKSIKDGEWQLSYFDENGDALGDKQADNPVDFLDKVSMGTAATDVTVVKNKKESESAAESYKEIEIPAMTANPFKEREKGREQAEARRKAWESILTDENLIAAEWTFPNGNKNVLSRSVKSDGWQLSWFNKEGEPFGDTQGESPMELYNRNPGDFTTKSGLKVSAVFSEERRYG